MNPMGSSLPIEIFDLLILGELSAEVASYSHMSAPSLDRAELLIKLKSGGDCLVTLRAELNSTLISTFAPLSSCCGEPMQWGKPGSQAPNATKLYCIGCIPEQVGVGEGQCSVWEAEVRARAWMKHLRPALGPLDLELASQNFISLLVDIRDAWARRVSWDDAGRLSHGVTPSELQPYGQRIAGRNDA